MYNTTQTLLFHKTYLIKHSDCYCNNGSSDQNLPKDSDDQNDLK